MAAMQPSKRISSPREVKGSTKYASCGTMWDCMTLKRSKLCQVEELNLHFSPCSIRQICMPRDAAEGLNHQLTLQQKSFHKEQDAVPHARHLRSVDEQQLLRAHRDTSPLL